MDQRRQVKAATNNLVGGRSQTYTYDEMNRLATAQSQATSGNDCWGQSYAYDRYASIWQICTEDLVGGLLDCIWEHLIRAADTDSWRPICTEGVSSACSAMYLVSRHSKEVDS